MRLSAFLVRGLLNRVQLFSSRGKFLGGAVALKAGTWPGQIHTPHGLALDSKGCLYVADTQNHRIQKFAVGGDDPWEKSPSRR
jgi:hypothetical protein